jgi:hypothetical protein
LLNGGSPHEKLLSFKSAVLTFAIVVMSANRQLSTAELPTASSTGWFDRNEVEL